ncbi:MAG: hemerythrin domain-containing protein [Streptosporangiaceae bacterium]
MTEVGLMPRRGQPPASADLTAQPPLTLAEEHVLLPSQVAARAEELLTAAAQGRWPGAELAALAGYARAEVLRQASDEKTLLFPAASPRDVAGLARDHARLRSEAEPLARAAEREQPMSPGQVTIAARDFVAQLERHLRDGENLPAPGRAQQGAPGTAVLGGHQHEWYPLTEGLLSTSTHSPRTRQSPRPWTGCCGCAAASRSNSSPAQTWTRYDGRSASSARTATCSPSCRTDHTGGGCRSPAASQPAS